MESIYQEERDGVKITIYPDQDPIGPEDHGDNSLFLVGYHRDFFIENDIKQDLAQCIARGGKYEDNSINEEARDYIKKYRIFGLEAYIHSGVVLALSNEGNFCDRQWDVSQLGLVFVSKEYWKTAKKARAAALSLINEWNDYLSGNVYGYVIEDAAGNDLDSCWGYYGDYEKYCLEEARSAADYCIKDLKEKTQQGRLVAALAQA